MISVAMKKWLDDQYGDLRDWNKYLQDYTDDQIKDVIKKYRLESSANVQSVKKALLKKDLINVDGQEISFNDSLFKQWLKRQTFYD